MNTDNIINKILGGKPTVDKKSKNMAKITNPKTLKKEEVDDYHYFDVEGTFPQTTQKTYRLLGSPGNNPVYISASSKTDAYRKYGKSYGNNGPSDWVEVKY